MKKCIIPLLVFLLLLCGCSQKAKTNTGTAFWYLRGNYQYGPEISMFACEYVNTDGLDTEAALKQYLEGPADAELRSPFHAGTVLVGYLEEEGAAKVTLSQEFASGNESDTHCAAICLAKTLNGFTGCEDLQIFLADAPDTVFLQLTPQDFALYDEVITDMVETPENEVKK